MSLQDYLIHSSCARPESIAATEGSGGAGCTYAALDHMTDRLRDRLAAMGVQSGDRIGIYLSKSIDSLAAIFGILKAGAAYVPVDPTAPPSRNAYIHNNCGVKAVVVERRVLESYVAELKQLPGPLPALLVLEGSGGGTPLVAALDALDETGAAPVVPTARPDRDDLAYILYTSGSTGKPKGVMLTHGNAMSFIDWCSQIFSPAPDDVFSSHAPFHFDLSILDIYLAIKHAGRLVLIGESASKDPAALSSIISTQKITLWYSAPSILSLIAQFGRIGEHDFSSVRIVLFAGEVFPIVHLRSLKNQLPHPRYFNLYGPTETNVCTYYELPARIEDDRVDPYPIGPVCENLEALVVDVDGREVAEGTEGELCIAGPNVMVGYWALPEQTTNGFLDARPDGLRWYKTGDLVVQDAAGGYRYVGRRDRMVKRRGYRVELGEIEVCLYRHPAIREAAVIALIDNVAGVTVKAHLSTKDASKLSIIELKTFCSRHLPLYMVPDNFVFHSTLPKTSTDKVDYQALKSS